MAVASSADLYAMYVEENGIRRSRIRFTLQQLTFLESLFATNKHPTQRQCQTAAEQLGMNLKTISIWFQNKRQTMKKCIQAEVNAEEVLPTTGADKLAEDIGVKHHMGMIALNGYDMTKRWVEVDLDRCLKVTRMLHGIRWEYHRAGLMERILT
ncbi:hypothetical protein C8J57DRAFT_1246887 [Mycena rebaudengoi]|nr:hypothetical protein C8J57DRAFT_1246887 [Mycena rebaudengoi]